MSGEAITTVAPAVAPRDGRRAPLRDPAWQATAGAGAAMIAGLALVLADARWATAAVATAVVGAVVAAFVLAPRALAAVHRQPALLAVGALLVLCALWVLGIGGGHGLYRVSALLEGSGTGLALVDLARSEFWWLLLVLVAATGGVVLIADALRVRLGLAGARRGAAPWRQMTQTGPAGRPAFPWRAIAGVLLVGWAAFVGLGMVGPYLSASPALLLVVVMLAVGAIAVVVGTPMLIAAVARGDQDDAAAARDRDRQRFAAHLHDSVLQTLALVQRQAHDPGAVTRLARRQEHALRAWMAGEAELASETLVAALRDVVAEVEDEQGVTIELSAIGDRPLDAGGEALTAAAREALRNAARHGAGAPVFVFAEVGAERAEVFVRDEGPGFVLEDVPTERRGVRDAIVGRMAAAGGRATVDSVPGEGTEVALRLGGAGR
jgi:signal transduction histidine kinase